MAYPSRTKSAEQNYSDLKHFVGVAGKQLPEILVKSDDAKEITNAVKQLGWLTEPALPNRFPHNSHHERWVGTLKSLIRASMLQSGFPEKVASWSIPFATISLSIEQPCPMHPHGKGAVVNILDAYTYNANRTCW